MNEIYLLAAHRCQCVMVSCYFVLFHPQIEDCLCMVERWTGAKVTAPQCGQKSSIYGRALLILANHGVRVATTSSHYMSLVSLSITTAASE